MQKPSYVICDLSKDELSFECRQNVQALDFKVRNLKAIKISKQNLGSGCYSEQYGQGLGIKQFSGE